MKLLIELVFVAALAAAAWLTWPTAYSIAKPWFNPYVAREEVAALQWIDANLPRGTTWAADLFACEALVALTRNVCAIGGAWELADKPIERFRETERLFITNDASEAWGIATKWRISYIFTHPRAAFYGYGYKPPSLEKFRDERYFKPLYEHGGVTLYKVMEATADAAEQSAGITTEAAAETTTGSGAQST